MKKSRFNLRAFLAFAHDTAATAAAWFLAFWLRFNLDLSQVNFGEVGRALLWVAPLQVFVFWRFGLYRGIWRYASLPDLRRILVAVGVAAMATPLLLLMVRSPGVLPRSVLMLDPILLVMFMTGSRVVYRAWKEHRLYGLMRQLGEPVLVLGAGSAALRLVKEFERSQDWRIVGLLDDDAATHGRLLHDVRVLGAIDELPRWARQLDVNHAIIAMPSASHTARRRAVQICSEAGMQALTVPSYEDLMSGKVTVSQVRKVELDDLLGRDPVVLDDAGLHGLLEGRAVMVTGAGGSIGSELCRQIVRFRPSRLVLFELNEFAMYRMEQEFAARFPDIPVVCAMGDVKDRTRLDQVLRQYRPAVIFHAAAYKHVPLMETDNAWQAVRNNVLGTYAVARAAMEHGVEKFVLISTDKAVNPTNVMGATKRLAEMVCQSLQSPLPPCPSTPLGISANLSASEYFSLPFKGRGGVGMGSDPMDIAPIPHLTSPFKGEERDNFALMPPRGEGGTRFVMVRFGNVLGSAGSVIPKFHEQIAAGGPVTVTHPEITRYFMSIPEAAQLVLQAGMMGQGGEIFVLDMGEPVKIADLARDMIRLSGFGESEIGIVYTGLRPGEKLYEELLADDERTLPTPHPKLRIAEARSRDGQWLEGLLFWLKQDGTPSDEKVKAKLVEWVPEYTGGAVASGYRGTPEVEIS